MLYLSNTIVGSYSYNLINNSNDLTNVSIQLDSNINYQWIFQQSFNKDSYNQLLDLVTNDYNCILKGSITKILTSPVNYTFDVGLILVNGIILSLCNYQVTNVTDIIWTCNKTLTLTDRISQFKYLPYRNNMIFTMKTNVTDTYTFNNFGFDITLKN